MSKERRNKLYNHFREREAKLAKERGETPPFLSIDPSEIEFIARTVWQNRSAISNDRDGFSNERMSLVWWRREKPLSIYNMVLLGRAEIKRLDAFGLVEAFEEECIKRVDAHLAEYQALALM